MTDRLPVGARTTVAIRPETVRIIRGGDDISAINTIRLPVEETAFLGSHFDITLRLGSNQMRVHSSTPPSGGEMTIELPPEGCRLFAASGATTA